MYTSRSRYLNIFPSTKKKHVNSSWSTAHAEPTVLHWGGSIWLDGRARLFGQICACHPCAKAPSPSNFLRERAPVLVTFVLNPKKCCFHWNELIKCTSSQDLIDFILLHSFLIGGIARIRFWYLMWSQLCRFAQMWPDLRIDQGSFMGKTVQAHVVRFPFPPCPCLWVREGGSSTRTYIWS